MLNRTLVPCRNTHFVNTRPSCRAKGSHLTLQNRNLPHSFTLDFHCVQNGCGSKVPIATLPHVWTSRGMNPMCRPRIPCCRAKKIIFVFVDRTSFHATWLARCKPKLNLTSVFDDPYSIRLKGWPYRGASSCLCRRLERGIERQREGERKRERERHKEDAKTPRRRPDAKMRRCETVQILCITDL